MSKPTTVGQTIAWFSSRRFRHWLQNIDYSIRNVINWRIVRAIGELQILTRASYVLLVLVPLLAAFWPTVLTAVEGERQAIESANVALQGASLQVEKAVEQARELAGSSAAVSHQLQRIDGAARMIESQATSYISRMRKSVEENPRLPWTLAAAFFAALAVVLGHFLYQLSVPERIKLYGWDAFVDKRKEEYSNHRTSEALERAGWYLKTPAGRRVDEANTRKDTHEIGRIYNDQSIDSPNRMHEELAELSPTRVRSMIDTISDHPFFGKDPRLEQLRDEFRAYLSTKAGTGEELIFQMGVIDRGARAEYQYLAGRNPFMIVASMVVYGVGLWLIVMVIYLQAQSVASAAGMAGLRDLFLRQ